MDIVTPVGRTNYTWEYTYSQSGVKPSYYPAESAEQLESVFQGLPTNLITKHEVLEIGFGFVGTSLVLAGLAFILGRAWRPLP
ncbi:MAG TPA: hypothetical protein VID26_12870 [Candidatus Limnocylindrales bacterium]